MLNHDPFVDIHCHLLPGLDDGARSWDEALQMARMAVAEGTATIIATPRQLGSFDHNSGELIRLRSSQFQDFLIAHETKAEILPGADVRVEPSLAQKLRDGSVLTLGDHGKHVLLKLPRQSYQPLDELIEQLGADGTVGILSHPERNQGLIKHRKLLRPLVDRGCLMQITADSLMGTFGRQVQAMAEWMLSENIVHFVASDAHGPRSRRPILSAAYQRAAALTCEELSVSIFSANPRSVAAGSDVPALPDWRSSQRVTWWPWRKAG